MQRASTATRNSAANSVPASIGRHRPRPFANSRTVSLGWCRHRWKRVERTVHSFAQDRLQKALLHGRVGREEGQHGGHVRVKSSRNPYSNADGVRPEPDGTVLRASVRVMIAREKLLHHRWMPPVFATYPPPASPSEESCPITPVLHTSISSAGTVTAWLPTLRVAGRLQPRARRTRIRHTAVHYHNTRSVQPPVLRG
jgi:hypothetical protein